MKVTEKQGEYGTIIFGVKSKLSEFVFRYPWRAMFALFLALEVATFLVDRDVQWLLKPIVTVLPLFLFITIILQYFCRNYCYKVIIQQQSKIITFYLMFNRGVVEKKIEGVRVLIDNNCKIVINGQVFVVFVEILHKMVSYLPQNTKISYAGFWGQLKEKDWKRRNLKLEPGSKSE